MALAHQLVTQRRDDVGLAGARIAEHAQIGRALEEVPFGQRVIWVRTGAGKRPRSRVASVLSRESLDSRSSRTIRRSVRSTASRAASSSR